MDTHPALLKTENKEMFMSRWEHDVWNDFGGTGKLKVEPILTISMLEQTNKATCFTSSDIIHDKSKPNRETYKCDQCQETMTSKQMLRQHKDSIHNDRKTFRCTISNCVRAFTSANYLKNHIDIEHTDCSEACIPCPKKDCGLLYPNNYRLKRHIRQDHRQEKLYKCHICARRFASLEVRNNHTNTKHVGAPLRENFGLKVLDANYYRTEQNKESENETMYAASPVSSRLESLNGQSSVDTTCEAQWLTKTSDSNPPLSKQIDRILCDIFSDKYQETLHSPLCSSELAIAIVSLEGANDDGKRKPAKVSAQLSSLISGGSSPLNSSYMFSEFDRKISSTNGRFKSSQYNPQKGVLKSSNSALMVAQNYPQSNTESEGHSTESQRSFLVNSSQHDEFSDISMESHLKDVFSSAVDKWNGYGNVSSPFDNPIKLLEYTCLDTMFDDFHEIVSNDNINTHNSVNGHPGLANNLPTMLAQKNHLLSLNNMHSKFLGGSQSNSIDHQICRSTTVPSNQIATLSNYELNRRKVNNGFPNKKSHPGPYDMIPHYTTDPNIKDPSFPMQLPPRCQMNPSVNRPLCPQDGRMRTNFQHGYPYGSSQQLMGNNQIYYNRDTPALYIQQHDRSPYPVCLNGPSNSNPLYYNPMELECINDSVSQTNQYQNIFRRRAPPTYQVGFNHQMLPSQHNAAVSLTYCPPSMHGSSCFPPLSSRGLYVDQSMQQQQQQQQQRQHQRHLLTNPPMTVSSQGQQSNSNYPTAAINDNPFSECEDSIVSEEQSSSVISNEHRSQTATSISSPKQIHPGLSQNCDITEAKSTVCI